MKILIASDSFKDSLSAIEVCQAIERGIKKSDTSIQTECCPLADGGEGTADILTEYSKGEKVSVEVCDPLFRPIEASYGISADGQTAFIEMAAASGIQLLKTTERNPWLTSTYGTGQLIKDAIQKGVKKIMLGIGSSATNDGGIGMAIALGYLFWDEQGQLLEGRGGDLNLIRQIDKPKNNLLDSIEVEVVCDVDNPLYGRNGAAYIYASQKGADEQMVENLDAGLKNYSRQLIQLFNKDIASISGAGAAGGMGAGAMAFLDANLKSGIDLVMDLVQFSEKIQSADYIITGEGKIDEQTLNGKVIKGITTRAAQYNIPVIALCGTLKATPEQIRTIGLEAAFSIINEPMELSQAIQQTAFLLEQTAFNTVNVLKKS